LDGMLRADAGARSAYYKAMTDVGAMTPNEIRRLENLPPMPGGDEIGIPTQERISVKETLPFRDRVIRALFQWRPIRSRSLRRSPSPTGGLKAA
jgi:hypothetical protein